MMVVRGKDKTVALGAQTDGGGLDACLSGQLRIPLIFVTHLVDAGWLCVTMFRSDG